MNRKASFSEQLMGEAVYLIILALFAGGMMLFLSSQNNATSMWTESYEKEIARVIDMAKPGDEIRLDVQKAVETAINNKVKNFDNLFSFDNLNKYVCVKLSLSKPSCYPFFNDVNVTDYKLEQAVPGNILSFKIVKSSGVTGGTS